MGFRKKSDLLPKAATAFCIGMERTCGTCGALTGAIMDISPVLGALKPVGKCKPHVLRLNASLQTSNKHLDLVTAMF